MKDYDDHFSEDRKEGKKEKSREIITTQRPIPSSSYAMSRKERLSRRKRKNNKNNINHKK